MITLIEKACTAGARLAKACKVVGLSPRTVQRYRQEGQIKTDGRKAAAIGRVPVNRLSEDERAEILAIANQPEYAHLPPGQIVPDLADKGCYLASESSFYRVLRSEEQLAPRGRAKKPTHKRPEPLQATAPNQLWSWDITFLPTTVRGLFFYLYLFIDLYSRKIVGFEAYAEESAEHASSTFRKTYLREGIAGKELTLHSDNGSPMKGATMLGTLHKLGVATSFSRPSVSNDNAYSEAMFRTMKYHPGYPDKPFDDLEEARHWVAGFAQWYNEKHRHSALKFVTPAQRHRGEDRDLLQQRTEIYEAAKARRPERWSGSIRDWSRPAVVTLNPQKTMQTQEQSKVRAA